MPSKLQKALAAVKDQTSISLAKVSGTTSSNLDVAVLKATTHEEVPIEDRFVNEVLLLTNSSRSYAAACVHTLARRLSRTRNWIVALKSLTLIFRILQDGDPHFAQEILRAMKRGARLLNLSNFRDDSNSSPWDYTAFARTFALYLDERLECCLLGKLHRRPSAAHHGRVTIDPVLHIRDMKPAILLDKIAYWQRLLDRAIATQPTGPAKTNRLVQISFGSIVRESFDLYRDISDGLALLLDSFFHLQHRNCVEAFHTASRAAKQFDELANFYSLCKSLGIGRTSEYPSVQKISDRLLETLQEFLKDNQSSFQPGKSPQRLALPAPPIKESTGSEPSDEQDLKPESSEEEEDREKSSDTSDQRGREDDMIDDGKQINASVSSFFDDQDAGDLISVNDPPSLADQHRNTTLDLALFDKLASRDRSRDLSLFLFEDQQKQELRPSCSDDGEKEGWELVLVETASSISEPSDLHNFYDPSSSSSLYHAHQNLSNPFLQGASETNAFLPAYARPTAVASSSTSSSPPRPTFCAANPELALPAEADPFSSVYCAPPPSPPNTALPDGLLPPAYNNIPWTSPHHPQISNATENQNFMFQEQQQHQWMQHQPWN